MDNTLPSWSQDRYNAVCSEVGTLLQSLRFDPASVRYIPVSGLTGINVAVGGSVPPKPTKGSSHSSAAPVCSWYTGQSILEALDSLDPISRKSGSRPGSEYSAVPSSLRAVVSYVTDHHKGCEVGVKILRGRLQRGRKVGFLGGAIGVATAHAVYTGDDHAPVDELCEGEQGAVLLVDRFRFYLLPFYVLTMLIFQYASSE